MKILYSCLSKSWGGMEMFTLQAVAQLLKRNIETELLCFPNSRIHSEAITLGVIVHTVKASGYFHPLEIIKLKKILKKGAFDLIHTQASKDLWVLVPALKLAATQIPLVMTKQVGSFIVKKDKLHQWIYNRVNLALAISQIIKKNLLDTCPLSDEKIQLLHNGVDTKRFDPAMIDKEKVRNEISIDKEELVIGMLARFSWGKGHEEFLFAAKELIPKYPNLKFMIVGEPSRGEVEYEQKIKALAREFGVEDKVVFTGFRKDTPEILASMDIFAFPSHSEAFGIALAEAMAMGKSSVCSNSDGVLDIAVDGVTSYLFQKQNGKDLADKLELLIKSPGTRTEFGEAARRRAVEMFDIEALTDKAVNIYKRLHNYKIS
ncbi:MAG: glycosyltransferase family 4 protein [Ignavibacteriales bacterium]|nr:glycosyltransferase family 4 protein [Ignavibacteriales bacterium]